MNADPLHDEIADLHHQHHTPNYAPEYLFVKGEGSYLWDSEGRRILDFVSGIAVTSLGHSHPALMETLKNQGSRLMHVSNLYYNDQAPRLAEELNEMTLGGKVFFCNSGAEANEGLIKIARKWGSDKGKHDIITMRNS